MNNFLSILLPNYPFQDYCRSRVKFNYPPHQSRIIISTVSKSFTKIFMLYSHLNCYYFIYYKYKNIPLSKVTFCVEIRLRQQYLQMHNRITALQGAICTLISVII